MYERILKRILDVLLSLAGIVVLGIPMLLISLAIKLGSPGPVFFRQKRFGLHKSFFQILKFRTMRTDTPKDVPTHMLADPTKWITRTGAFLRRTSLDELPQLFNILDGSMSLVGPRPERQYFYQKFEEYIPGFSRRLAVTPGLTGYAQVNGGYSLPPEEKIVYDMYYIENQSLRMDLHCLVKTVQVVFTGNGAR